MGIKKRRELRNKNKKNNKTIKQKADYQIVTCRHCHKIDEIKMLIVIVNGN